MTVALWVCDLGVTIKAYLVDLEKETLSDPVVVRSHQSDTVADLTQDVADAFNVSHEKMRLCVEQYYRDVKLLEPPSKPLKQEGFYKAVKVSCVVWTWYCLPLSVYLCVCLSVCLIYLVDLLKQEGSLPNEHQEERNIL